jgi:hypothetical protein
LALVGELGSAGICPGALGMLLPPAGMPAVPGGMPAVPGGIADVFGADGDALVPGALVAGVFVGFPGALALGMALPSFDGSVGLAESEPQPMALTSRNAAQPLCHVPAR